MLWLWLTPRYEWKDHFRSCYRIEIKHTRSGAGLGEEQYQESGLLCTPY